MITEKEIMDYYAGRKLNTEEAEYLRHSVKKICRILNIISELLKTALPNSNNLKLLDIGPHFLTEQIHRYFPAFELNTLGFENPQLYDVKNIKNHFQFDLNDAQFAENWPAFEKHDCIVMSEVLEHLYTSPVLIFSFLKTLLKPGGFLLLTTPNAVAISKRLQLLAGRHPYEMLRQSRENPGHIREYTRPELVKAGETAGLRLVSASLENYFITDDPFYKFIYGVSALVPGLRTGLIMVLTNPA
jgi:hypothetical protein